MPLDYLSCFAVVLRGIHVKVDIRQIFYSIHSKLRIFPYSEVTNRSTTFMLMKGQQRLKNTDQLLNLMFLFFLSFSSLQCPRKEVSQTDVERAIFLHASN